VTVDRTKFAVFLVCTALLLFLGSFILDVSYAGPEPFEEFRRADAFWFIGGASAAIALWGAWSLSLAISVGLGVFRVRALLGLLIAVIAVYYLAADLTGYLDDLERMMPLSE
jgi:hypothetical protein